MGDPASAAEAGVVEAGAADAAVDGVARAPDDAVQADPVGAPGAEAVGGAEAGLLEAEAGGQEEKGGEGGGDPDAALPAGPVSVLGGEAGVALARAGRGDGDGREGGVVAGAVSIRRLDKPAWLNRLRYWQTIQLFDREGQGLELQTYSAEAVARLAVKGSILLRKVPCDNGYDRDPLLELLVLPVGPDERLPWTGSSRGRGWARRRRRRRRRQEKGARRRREVGLRRGQQLERGTGGAARLAGEKGFGGICSVHGQPLCLKLGLEVKAGDDADGEGHGEAVEDGDDGGGGGGHGEGQAGEAGEEGAGYVVHLDVELRLVRV